MILNNKYHLLEIIMTIIVFICTIYICYNLYKGIDKPINNFDKDYYKELLLQKDSIINNIKNQKENYKDTIIKIKIKYKTIYENYSNNTIISDDSITSYITSKIYNK
jgi:hypothetical protein